MLLELQPRSIEQLELDLEGDGGKVSSEEAKPQRAEVRRDRTRLMSALDQVNGRYALTLMSEVCGTGASGPAEVSCKVSRWGKNRFFNRFFSL